MSVIGSPPKSAVEDQRVRSSRRLLGSPALPANSIAYIAISIDRVVALGVVAAGDLGVLAARVALGQRVDAGPVLVGEAHELADHLRRQARR